MHSDIFSTPFWTERLKNTDEPIILYGTGNGADKIKAILDRHGIKISGVAVSDGFAFGKTVYGHVTKPISHFEHELGRFTCIVCFGTEGGETEFVRELSGRQTVICPDAPVFGDEWQTPSLLRREAEDIKRVYGLLADEISRKIFTQNLTFSVTGEPDVLTDLEGGENPPREYFSHGKAHIDIGAFDGDTALEYASHSDSYSAIYAVEPDEATYKRLIKNTAGIRGIHCICAAAGNSSGEAGLNAKHSRGTGVISGTGCKVITVDGIAGRRYAFGGGMPVGSIKIDAEGMDTAVIEGAVNTVCEERPCIAVSVYHRAGDIWRIPLYLHRLCGKYRFYVRRKRGLLPAWDTLIYAVTT